MNRGFVIVAQNNNTTDYIECASVLAQRIRTIMPDSSVSLLTDRAIKNSVFDHVIRFPHGDQCKKQEWKLANDWQVYDASPYNFTIKLEADIYLPRSIEHWWKILRDRDLVLTTTIRNYTNQISRERFYRKVVDDTGLPDVYNAITYFRRSKFAEQFFSLVRDIFENWDQYRSLLVCYEGEQATTDFVYALAARILGEENCIMPDFTDMSMIHMKQMINAAASSDWTREYLYELDSECFRINTIPQLYPVHYHVKHFAQIIKQELYEPQRAKRTTKTTKRTRTKTS